MANPTGFITNKIPYSNQDLNTVFAPFQQIDKGTLGATYQNTESPNTLIRTSIWSWFPYINQLKNSGNISIINNVGTSPPPAGFKINFSGIYKLNLILFFVGGQGTNDENGALVNLFLQNSNIIPVSNTYSSPTMIPSPNMAKIYSMSICGASSYGTGTGAIGNGNNNSNNSNLLGVNADDATTSNITTRPYFFRFIINNSASNNGTIKNNIQTIEILFEGIKDQYIYPFINVSSTGGTPSTTLDAVNSKWLVTKLEPIPNSIAELNLQNYTQLYNNPCNNLSTLYYNSTSTNPFNRGIVVSLEGEFSPNTFRAITATYGTIDPSINNTSISSLLNKTILVDMYTTSSTSVTQNTGVGICNLFFGNNSSGAGFMIRLDGRTGAQSGIGTTTNWNTGIGPTNTSNININLSPNIWYTFVISIDSYGNISWAAQESGTSNFVNNTIYSSFDTGVTTKVNPDYNWLAVNGDNLDNSTSYFKNIIIYDSATL